MHPRQIRETSSPVFPSFTYSMAAKLYNIPRASGASVLPPFRPSALWPVRPLARRWHYTRPSERPPAGPPRFPNASNLVAESWRAIAATRWIRQAPLRDTRPPFLVVVPGGHEAYTSGSLGQELAL